jgi:signal transduction histidine kinase
LTNISQRVSSIKGKVNFSSKKEKGFKVDIEIPVN